MKPKEDGRPKTMLYKFPGTMLTHGVKADGEIHMADLDYIVVPSTDIQTGIDGGWSLTPYQAVYKSEEPETPDPVVEEPAMEEPEEIEEKMPNPVFNMETAIEEINKIRGRKATDRLTEYAAKQGITLDDTNKYTQMKAELIDALGIKYGMD